MNRAQGSFIKAIVGLLRQFHSVSMETEMEFLNTICVPIHGCGLWINRTGASVNLRKVIVYLPLWLEENFSFRKIFQQPLFMYFLGLSNI